MGAGISGGGPPWAHEAGGRALHPRGQVAAPPRDNFCTVNPQIIPKNHINLAWHSEDFYFRDIFILPG